MQINWKGENRSYTCRASLKINISHRGAHEGEDNFGQSDRENIKLQNKICKLTTEIKQERQKKIKDIFNRNEMKSDKARGEIITKVIYEFKREKDMVKNHVYQKIF